MSENLTFPSKKSASTTAARKKSASASKLATKERKSRLALFLHGKMYFFFCKLTLGDKERNDVYIFTLWHYVVKQRHGNLSLMLPPGNKMINIMVEHCCTAIVW